ncbi:MAG: lamin tail domain-containing protein [Candidatus Aenigmatarchaeota archaeon]
MKGLVLIAVFLLLVFVSGCTTETADIIEENKMTISEKPKEQSLIQEENARDEFIEFISNTSNQTFEEKKKQQEEQKCPQTCSDSNPCTRDFCSKDTNYECSHEKIIPCCGNNECEEEEDYKNCPNDCQKPPCTLKCDRCEILDTDSCICLPNGCVSGDGCCPDKCSHSSDSDCPNMDKCEHDSECDDNNQCTSDICAGTPKECTHLNIIECLNNDSCCPENCTYLDDSDCPRPSLVFSEIYYNSPGSDEKHEWIEIYNNGTIAVDVTKLRLEESGTQHTIKNSTNLTYIKAGEYAVIAENSDQFLIDYPECSCLIFDSSFSLSNTGEELLLRLGKNGEIIDSVFYNSTWGGNGNGFSIEKIKLNNPNTQDNWKQSIKEKGTPGQKNSVS